MDIPGERPTWARWNWTLLCPATVLGGGFTPETRRPGEDRSRAETQRRREGLDRLNRITKTLDPFDPVDHVKVFPYRVFRPFAFSFSRSHRAAYSTEPR